MKIPISLKKPVGQVEQFAPNVENHGTNYICLETPIYEHHRYQRKQKSAHKAEPPFMEVFYRYSLSVWKSWKRSRVECSPVSQGAKEGNGAHVSMIALFCNSPPMPGDDGAPPSKRAGHPKDKSHGALDGRTEWACRQSVDGLSPRRTHDRRSGFRLAAEQLIPRSRTFIFTRKTQMRAHSSPVVFVREDRSIDQRCFEIILIDLKCLHAHL